MVAYGLWGPPAGRVRVMAAGLRVTALVGVCRMFLVARECFRDRLLHYAQEAP